MRQALAERLDSLLPQTQCRRCGYDDCAAYAEALAKAQTTPDRCPPGGEHVAERLATALDTPPLPVDADCGEAAPWRLAVIREAECIGCTRCIAACPVDAIVGAAKLMHAVIADECTGCDLCLPACPVDCIDMRPAGGDAWTPLGDIDVWFADGAPRARARYVAARGRAEGKRELRAARRAMAGAVPPPAADRSEHACFVAEALARARARRMATDG